jgi:hypothetical protein
MGLLHEQTAVRVTGPILFYRHLLTLVRGRRGDTEVVFRKGRGHHSYYVSVDMA